MLGAMRRRGSGTLKRSVADSLVALGIFVTSLVVGAALLVGGFLVAARTLGNHADPVASGRATDFLVVRGQHTCDSEMTAVPVPVMGSEPSALLVCADPHGSTPWQAPTDVVEGDLTPLLRVLGDLDPAPDAPYDCTFRGGPAYDLLIRFSRTTYARVHGDTGGCGVVTSNGNDYLGADEVLDAALALVEEQRGRTAEPTAVPEAPPCPADQGEPTAYSLIGDPRDMVVAVSCWRRNGDSMPDFGPPTPVPRRDLRALLSDV